MKNRGKLIVICGTDGSGKGTQTKLLVEKLEKVNMKVKMVDFPRYGKKSAGMVEEYLNGKFGDANEVGPYRGSIFYAIDRYAASFEMKKWLDEGYVVISNRYTSANKGHQAGKIENLEERDKFLDWENNLEYDLFDIPKEDMNIFLYVDPEISQKLVDNKEKRSYTDKKRDIHEADLNHLKNAANAYKYVAEKENWEIINCVKNNKIMSIESIHELIWKKIIKILNI
ncbi:thymidylate kinase [Patescibacteria group bacterium]|nr:thymidylate kinase [Patescibacteria group bacterium]